MKILKTNQTLRLVDNNVEIHNSLPVGTYTLEYNAMTNDFFLSQQDFTKFKVPSKMYGNIDAIVERVIQTYKRRDKKLGIMLQGEKGTGKSIISKMIINQLGVPVIMIKDFYANSSAMESFLNELKVPFVIFIDEFEKIYRNDEMQAKLLSIMDGTGQSDIFFILTSNSNNISQYLKNRPGRIFYNIKFEGLEEDIIKEVVSDLVTDSVKAEIILRACVIVGTMNFDLLLSIIEEVNNTDIKDVNELMYYLNMEPSEARYDGYAFPKSNSDVMYSEYYQSNPLMSRISVESYAVNVKTGKPMTEEAAKEASVDYYADITAELINCTNLVINPDSITFENEDYRFVFKKVKIRRLVF